MLVELPFTAAEGWLDVRQGFATKDQAVKKGGIQVAWAGAWGFVTGSAAFAVSALSAPLVLASGSLFGAVGLHSTGKRSWNIYQRFRNRNLKALLPSQQRVLSVVPIPNVFPFPQMRQPISWLQVNANHLL